MQKTDSKLREKIEKKRPIDNLVDGVNVKEEDLIKAAADHQIFKEQLALRQADMLMRMELNKQAKKSSGLSNLGIKRRLKQAKKNRN